MSFPSKTLDELFSPNKMEYYKEPLKFKKRYGRAIKDKTIILGYLAAILYDSYPFGYDTIQIFDILEKLRKKGYITYKPSFKRVLSQYLNQMDSWAEKKAEERLSEGGDEGGRPPFVWCMKREAIKIIEGWADDKDNIEKWQIFEHVWNEVSNNE